MLNAASDTVSNGSGLGAFFAVLLVAYIAVAVVAIVAWVKIISKAGYSGWWVLIVFVPIANVVMFLVFAFSDWPVLQRARAQAGLYSPPGSAPIQYL